MAIKTNKKKGTAKYDWIKMKQEYLDSDEIEVTRFLHDTYKINYNTVVRQVANWRTEKEAYKKAIFQAKQDKLINDPDIVKQKQILLTALKNAELQVANLIGNPNNKFSIADLKNIKLGWEMLRIATGQSSNNIGLDEETKDLVINLKL